MKMDEGEIRVSVLCMCYNHESYLRQCLDSIIEQKTTFPFRIIVHDDASTDGSAGILREYEERFPTLVRGIYQTRNVYSREGFSGVQRALFEESEGKYIAFCECDDYWLDPCKLQKQYEAAEEHGAVFCTHRVRRVRENGERAGGAIPEIGESFVKTSEEFIKHIFKYDNPNCFVFQAGSYFIRRDIFEEEPPAFMKLCCVGDVPQELFCAAKGNAVYLAEEMSCYRVMSSSSWNKEVQQQAADRQIAIQRNMIECLKAYEDYTKHQYDRLIERKIAEIELGILVLGRRFKEIGRGPHRKFLAALTPKKRLKFWLYGHCPRLMEAYDRKRRKRY